MNQEEFNKISDKKEKFFSLDKHELSYIFMYHSLLYLLGQFLEAKREEKCATFVFARGELKVENEFLSEFIDRVYEDNQYEGC